LITDLESVVKCLNDSCFTRGIPKTVQAVCQVGPDIYFVLRHNTAETDHESRYHIIELTDTSQKGFVCAVNTRHQGSTDIVGTLTARGTVFAVFRNQMADA
jgi:hypothetical protein